MRISESKADAPRGNGPPSLTRLRRRFPLAERADLRESLDAGPAAPPAHNLAANLADLARLNRLPGGTSASVAAIRRLVPARRDLQILDVGAGGGDMALAFARHGWSTVALDANPEVLRIARDATAGVANVTVQQGDGAALDFPDATFDVSHCSLLLHHLDPGEAVSTLREMARVARHGVVVNDLRRGVVPFVLTAVGVAVLGRARETRVDGLISARRAYTLGELDRLLADAGLMSRWRSMALMPRVVTAAVPRPGR